MPHKDKEKQKQNVKKNHLANADEIAIYQKEYWTERNKELKASESERKRQWYLKNKEKSLASQRAYREQKKKREVENLLKQRNEK